MSYGRRRPPQYLLCCCGLPYVVIVVVFFIFWGWEYAHFTHRLEVCIFLFLSVVYVCFPGGFVSQDGMWFFPCCELCLLLRLELCNSLGSHFGHDRAKNDSGIVFPV